MNRDHGEWRRLSRWETLTAWLGRWKPRDVEVPPIPRRKIALTGGVLVVLLAAAAGVAVPAIDSGKDEGAEREARADTEARAAERRRLRAEQAAHHGRAPRGADRTEVVRSLEASIAADARRRVAAGDLDGPIRRVSCRPSRRDGSYGCTAVTREIPAGPRNVPGSLGHPFIAVVDFEGRRYTWCKTNPIPAERAVPDPRDVIELPRECTGL